MSFFKFTPDLMSQSELEQITIGREYTISSIVESLKHAAETQRPAHFILVGQRGIGKTHSLLTIYYELLKRKDTMPIRLSEEEYSITRIEELFQKIVAQIPEIDDSDKSFEECLAILHEKQRTGRFPMIFVDNLQLLFEQLETDLPRLRSVLQEHSPFCIVGSALTTFDAITSYELPFYNFFEIIRLKGLSEEEVGKLIEKRLRQAGRNEMADSISNFKERIKGVYLLTGGNPRLIHSLAEILIQKSSLEDIESNLLELLDQLTPYYQARMELLPVEKRKLIDMLALADGPLSPKELAEKSKMKNNIVVTQLRRLQNDGIVEPVKFSSKRMTRYQLVERLYRIWREMRTPRAGRITLFIEFLRLWYSPTELESEYDQMKKKLDDIIKVSVTDAKRTLHTMCYVADTLPLLKLLELSDIVMKLAQVGDLKRAEDEIGRYRIQAAYEKDPILKLSMELDSQLTETELFEKFYKDKPIDQNAANIKNLLAKLEVASSGKKGKLQMSALHEMFYRAAVHYFEREAPNEAGKYTDLSLENTYHNCQAAISLKCALLLELEKPNELLNYIEQNIDKIDESNMHHVTYLRMNAYAMLGNPETINEARRLLPGNLDYAIPAFSIIASGNKPEEAIERLRQVLPEIKKIETEERRKTIVRIATMVLHVAIHQIEYGEHRSARLLIELINDMKEEFTKEDVLAIVLNSLKSFKHSHSPDSISQLISHLQDVLGSTMTESLHPLITALLFIEKREIDILEKLHKESRELVLDIIKVMQPDIEIPQAVYDSL